MNNKSLTLSVIVPTYNEEDYIGACLEALAAQTVKPDEVIVVDNNSTDNTVKIAKKYDFVRVIHEDKQGLIHARNAGFAAAKCDVLGRIDADSKVIKDWVKIVRGSFTDESVAGITGPGYLVTLPLLSNSKSLFWNKLYNIGALGYYRFQVLWGANMAIRADVWEQVREYTELEDSEVHEDQDISMLMNMHGHSIKYVDSMRVYSEVERFYDPKKLYEYYQRGVKTVFRARSLRKAHSKPRTTEVSLLKSVAIIIVTFPFMLASLLLAFLHAFFSKIT